MVVVVVVASGVISWLLWSALKDVVKEAVREELLNYERHKKGLEGER